MAKRAPAEKTNNIDLQKLKVGFWTTRLDHTLSHTVNASRLIYIVDGAVLALLAACIDSLGVTRPVVFIMSFPMFILALINLFHSEFVRLQHYWYGSIEAKIVDVLGDQPVPRPPKKKVGFASGHGVFRSVHILIAIGLFIIALVMILYGLGYFPEIITIREVDQVFTLGAKFI